MTSDVAHADPQTLNWLLANFVRGTAGVREAVAVSSDGLLVATSDGLDRDAADLLAALVSGVAGLADSASRSYDFHGLKLIMIEMAQGFLLVRAINDRSFLGVIAGGHCDIGLIGFEMSTLADRAGLLLTPESIAQLRATLP